MAITFAQRMEDLKASEIREILKITQQPQIISFAGGLPAPELFPITEIKEITKRLLDECGQEALQYATTEGLVPLREKIAERMNAKFQTQVVYQNILITSGSQQGLDLSGKAFLNQGDVVLCESPTYLGAINAFKVYGPRFIEVPTDDHGMIIDELKKILANTQKVKLIYVIPDFQNPTGRTWSLERRLEFMEVINEYEVPVIEDNPYGELRFEGVPLPSLKALDKKGLVMFLGTFSKTFCPGYRIGWVAADQSVLEKYILLKQSADLQTSTIAQLEISKFLEMFDLDEHVEKIKRVYKSRRDCIIDTMKKEFPAGLKFNCPDGGLFTWVELDSSINARDVLIESLEHNVAFVPGGSFYPNGGKENTFRLNYSNMPEERIVEGVKRLAKVLEQYSNS